MSKFVKKFVKKSKDYRTELSRAHLIITLLSMSIITLLTLGTIQSVSFDETLSAICVVLLSIVALVSACMSVSLFRKK